MNSITNRPPRRTPRSPGALRIGVPRRGVPRQRRGEACATPAAGWRGLLAALLMLWGPLSPLSPRTAHAATFVHTDASGVVHYSNVPRLRPPAPDATAPRRDTAAFDALIVAAAVKASLPASLVKAVVAVESRFDPAAVSHAGAAGLMQLMPRTAQALRVVDRFDPAASLEGGSIYLRQLLDRFAGDTTLALAAYHAGPRRVERCGRRVPNIAPTRNYVTRVMMLYRHYDRSGL